VNAVSAQESVLGLPCFESRITCLSSLTSDQIRKAIATRVLTCSVLTLIKNAYLPALSADALAIFGPWMNSEEELLPLIRHGLPVYIDDPTLALRLSTTIFPSHLPECSLVGLLSPFDHSGRFAAERLASGAMGAVYDVATMRRDRDPIASLEAAAILDQLLGNKSRVSVRHVSSLSIKSSVDIWCKRGHLRIPIPLSHERDNLRGIRLEHFSAVARNEAQSAFRLRDLERLSKWIS
jgi:hypothetical protein